MRDLPFLIKAAGPGAQQQQQAFAFNCVNHIRQKRMRLVKPEPPLTGRATSRSALLRRYIRSV